MEMRLAELEVLMDQNILDGRAAASELSSLAANNGDHQPDMNLADTGFTSGNYPEIKAKNCFDNA